MSLALHTQYAAELHGPGRVGKEVLRLLEEANIAVAAVHGRGGPESVDPVPGPRIFIDCTPPDYVGDEWIDTLDEVLASGTPVVTCNKAPLARAWDRLHRHGTPIGTSATVGGGTGLIPYLQRLHRSAGVARVDAVLNGTTSHVLAAVHAGARLEDAIVDAQARGLAEPDARLDLDGTDALAKAVILHHLLFGAGPRLDALPRLQLAEDEIRSRWVAPRHVVSLTPGSIRSALRPSPDWLPAGATAGIRVATANGDEHVVAGPGAGPLATACNLLSDVFAIAGR